jgi:uncharacterized delta-60 repeat protein
MKFFYLSFLACIYTAILYAQAGSLNTSFGGGAVFTPMGSDDKAGAITVQPDGKVLIAGTVSLPNKNFALVRYNTDGSFDNGFGIGGKVTMDIGGGTLRVRAVVVQPDGKIIVGGSSFRPGTKYDFLLLRYNTNGTLDSSFGNGGKVITHLIASDHLNGLELQPDGRIVAGGFYQNTDAGNIIKNLLVRYHPNGRPDSSFGVYGVTTTQVGSHSLALAMARSADGKLVLAGGAVMPGNHWDIAITRYTASGQPDSIFGVNGSATTPIYHEDFANAVAIQPDGKIIAGGRDMALLRYNTNGSLDSSFGTDGKVLMDLNGSNYYSKEIRDLLIQPDGKILITGYAHMSALEYDVVLIRYNSNGSFDSTFGINGKVSTALTLYDMGEAIALDGSKIYLAANTQAAPCYSGSNCGQKWVALSYNNDAIVLPVQIVSFTATLKERYVQLQWQVTNNDEASLYQLERSTDGKDFFLLGSVAGINGADEKTYSFTDAAPAAINYYRIRTFHRSGNETISKSILIRVKNKDIITISPNPVRDRLFVQLKDEYISNVQLIDISGRVLTTIPVPRGNIMTTFSVDVSTLAPGLYLIRAGTTSRQFLVVK